MVNEPLTRLLKMEGHRDMTPKKYTLMQYPCFRDRWAYILAYRLKKGYLVSYIGLDYLEELKQFVPLMKESGYFKLFKLMPGDKYITLMTKPSWLRMFQKKLVRAIMKSPHRERILEGVKRMNKKLEDESNGAD